LRRWEGLTAAGEDTIDVDHTTHELNLFAAEEREAVDQEAGVDDDAKQNATRPTRKRARTLRG